MGPKIIHMAYIIWKIQSALLDNLKLEMKFEELGTNFDYV